MTTNKWGKLCTYILKKSSVLRQSFGRKGFCDMVEGEQGSVLLQAILTLH